MILLMILSMILHALSSPSSVSLSTRTQPDAGGKKERVIIGIGVVGLRSDLCVCVLRPPALVPPEGTPTEKRGEVSATNEVQKQ